MEIGRKHARLRVKMAQKSSARWHYKAKAALKGGELAIGEAITSSECLVKYYDREEQGERLKVKG